MLEADRARLERAALAVIAARVHLAQSDAISAYRRSQSVSTAIGHLIHPLRETIVDYMVAADLLGRVRSQQAARRTIAFSHEAMWFGPISVYKQVVQFTTARLGLSDQAVAELRDTYGARAATVTGDVVGLLESKVQAAVSEALGKGLHNREGMKLIAEAFDAAGVTPANSYTIENTFRTQTALAYNAGRMNANRDPAIQEILWGYEYNTVGDDRVRPAHAAMDGVRAPKNDPLWNTWTPPCGYSCRCTLIEIFKEDGAASATKVPTTTHDEYGNEIPVLPDPGWAFNPADLFASTLTRAR